MPFDEVVEQDSQVRFVTNPNVEDHQIADEKVDNASASASVFDAIGLSFKYENTIVSALSNPEGIYDVDIDFNPFEEAKTMGHEDIFVDYQDVLGDAVSKPQYDFRVSKIRQEQEDHMIMAASPWGSFAGGVLGGVLDWTSLIPVGALVKTAKAGAKGYSLLKSAGSVGAATAGATSIQEVGLHMSQVTRTKEESFYNIAASTVMGAALGVGASALMNGLNKSAVDDVLKKMSDDLEVPADGAPIDNFDYMKSSAGAAQAATGGTKIQSALGLEKVISFQDPKLRQLNSSISEPRQIVQQMGETPFFTEGNVKGEVNAPNVTTNSDNAKIGTIETRKKMHTVSAMGQVQDIADRAFSEYRFGKETFAAKFKATGQDIIGSSGGKLSRIEFNEQISHALRNGDTHDNQYIDISAKAYRKIVLEPAKNRAIELGMLPENVSVKEADSYLMRSYNKEKIRADIASGENRFTNSIFEDFKNSRERDALELELDDTGTRIKEELSALQADLRHINSVRGKQTKEIASKKAKLEEREKQLNSKLRQSDRDLQRSGNREGELKPTEFDNEEDKVFFGSLLRDLKKGEVAPTASPIKIIQGMGGVKDESGELLNIIGKKSARPRLINDDAEWSLDQAGFFLEDAGYFDHTPTVNEILDLVRRSHSDPKIFPEFDLDQIAVRNKNIEIEDMISELDELEFNYSSASSVELMSFMRGVDFKAKGARVTGRMLENRKAYTRALKRIEGQVKQADKVADELDDLFALNELYKKNATEFSVEAKKMQKSISELTKKNKAAKKRSEVLRHRVDKTDDELMDTARQTVNRILSHPEGRLPYDIDIAPNSGRSGGSSDLKGTFKSRALTTSDNILEPFLENDINLLSRKYLETMWGDIGLMEKFGDVNMTLQFKEIDEAYDAAIKKTPNKKQKNKLLKEKFQSRIDIEAMRKMLRNEYKLPDNPDSIFSRIFTTVRSLNYLRLLGGMTLAAIPDMGRIVMVHSLSGTIGKGLIPLFKNFSTFKLSVAEAKKAGVGWETVTNARNMAMADIMDDYGRHSKFERAIHGATQNFGIVSLMSIWNDAMKNFASVVTQTNMLQAIDRSIKGKATPNDVRNIAASNIDKSMIKRMHNQFEKYGHKDDNVWFGNTDQWTDMDAVDAYKTALIRDVDRIVVTPGLGEKPLWMSTELGKQVGQFKSFGLASVHRTMISGLQQRDLAALNGAMLMIALGGVTHVVREGIKGKEVDYDNKSALIVNAFDRSGLSGWLMEANNIAEKLTRGRVGLSAFTGKQVSRYQSRNILGALMGPSAGFISDFSQVTGGLFEGDWKESDTRAIRRIMPYQNVFWLRQLLDQAEDGINRNLGIK